MSGRTRMSVLAALLTLGAYPALAQMPVPGDAMTAPAPPETLEVWLGAANPEMECRVIPDGSAPIRFGEPWELELIPRHGSALPDSLTVSVPWFSLQRVMSPEGTEQLLARVTRAGPFRLGWDRSPTTLSEVLVVEGRLAAGEGPDPVRDPWRLQRRRWPLYVAAVLALVLAVLLWRWSTRRGAVAVDRITDPAPDPAWARFMVDAAELADSGLPDGPGARPVLDAIDRMLRRYLQHRFGVDGAALAPGEVAPALTSRRYPDGGGDAFDGLLRALDLQRYAPTAEASVGSTRRLLETAVSLVESSSPISHSAEDSGRAGPTGEAARRKLHGLLRGGEAT